MWMREMMSSRWVCLLFSFPLSSHFCGLEFIGSDLLWLIFICNKLLENLGIALVILCWQSYAVRINGFYLLLSGGDEGTYLEAGGAWP